MAIILATGSKWQPYFDGTTPGQLPQARMAQLGMGNGWVGEWASEWVGSRCVPSNRSAGRGA